MESATGTDINKSEDTNEQLKLHSNVKESDIIINSDLPTPTVALTSKVGLELEKADTVNNSSTIPSATSEQPVSKSSNAEPDTIANKVVDIVPIKENIATESVLVISGSGEKGASKDVDSDKLTLSDEAGDSSVACSVRITEESIPTVLPSMKTTESHEQITLKEVKPPVAEHSEISSDVATDNSDVISNSIVEADDSSVSKSTEELSDEVRKNIPDVIDDSIKSLDNIHATEKNVVVDQVNVTSSNEVDSIVDDAPRNKIDALPSEKIRAIVKEHKIVDESSICTSETEKSKKGDEPAEAKIQDKLSEDKIPIALGKESDNLNDEAIEMVASEMVAVNTEVKTANDLAQKDTSMDTSKDTLGSDQVSDKDVISTIGEKAVNISESMDDATSSTSEVDTVNVAEKPNDPTEMDTVTNDDDILKSSVPEEPSSNPSEAGDDDQEMQEFLHVSAKDKDLDDPMCVDATGSEEMMEASNPTDEDPIGLVDEPDHTKILDIPEEPMDVDDISEKSQELPDMQVKVGVDMESDVDNLAGDGSLVDTADTTPDVPEFPVPTDSAVQSAETADDAAETTDCAGGTTNAGTDTADVGTADASDGVVVDDETPGEEVPVTLEAAAADDDDEEICIIPDTFRVPTVTPDGSAVETAKETVKDSVSKKDGGETNEKTSDVKIIASLNIDKGKTIKAVTIEAKPAVSGRPQRLAAKKAETQIKELAKVDAGKDDSTSEDSVAPSRRRPDEIRPIEPTPQECYQCNQLTPCKYQMFVDGATKYLCEESCTKLFRKERDSANVVTRSPQEFMRKCGQCSTQILGEEKNLSWETMDFCNEECLGKYMTELGSFCANCKGPVAGSSLGKYCVRFGYDIKQFCMSSCLEEFKKGLKVCSYCQKDISNDTDGFLAPVGDKGQFKDFCTQKCMAQYDHMGNNQPPPSEMHECDVCNNEKVVQVEVLIGPKLHKLCSDPCFAAFKFVNKVDADQCEMCKKYFDKMKTEMFSVFYEEAAHNFCSKTCMNVYILANRKIVPCHWCKVKKYNFDMIKRVTNAGQVIMMCSLNCLTLYQVSVSAVSSKKILCDYCKKVNQAQYHLTMSDATIRNFCAYTCVMAFQNQYSKSPPLTLPPGIDKPVIPTGGPKRNTANTRRSITVAQNENQSMPTQTNSLPVISSVQSLAPNGQQSTQAARAQALKTNNINVQPKPLPQVVYKQQVVVKPPTPKEVRNKGVSCKPIMLSKGTSIRPTQGNKETQTDESIGRPIFIPVPIPIYVPAPMHMYSMPFPMPVPFPLPIPVPMFIPTSRNSISGILKEIKRIQEKIPNDPFEAELLMMAEMVAGEKKAENSDSDSDDGDNGAGDVSEVPEASSVAETGFSPEAVDTSNFGEDMFQMALKMASELDEPAVDLEAALTPSTITAQSNTSMEQNDVTESEVDDPEPVLNSVERSNRGRKRGLPVQRRGSMGSPSKRGRRISSSGGDTSHLPPPDPPAAPRVEVEKPDANMCLKYTFGVNAWRQWVNVKNTELEKASNNRKLKLFKPEILQLTSDELNYSLCLFVKEVRKPNGSEYAPDTIYYLVLGIQQYLFENGRIDNIFTDAYYEKFTECLDEVAKKFSQLFNEQQYIVTRVEEEHLWESKQLGAHSPHVLLSTLMFFNTKHFNLTTVEEHMQLSFSHIMKHWKRNPNQPGAVKVPGSRNVLLRFYPPQASLEANSRKKKVYEQQENEENPLRCPVKLYEFYLSKCPESVKTRNDVFYLLPERSCVPDSPVWYSTMALGRDPLVKMLHRVKMVKEINMALLTS